jgi:hypothetical protein
VFVEKGFIIQDIRHFRYHLHAPRKILLEPEVNEQYRRYKIRKNVESAPSPLLNHEIK